MNDFHLAVLWVRAFEIAVRRFPKLTLSDGELNQLFLRYRSPYKA
jgi:hypothetical protein